MAAERSARVALVRHGETEWSKAGLHTGRTDVALTAKGREQAVHLGARLRSWRFARVLSSPLSRAEETCRLAGLGAGMEVREQLHEWDYGAYEGRTTAAIRDERPGWLLWRDGVPRGETSDDVGRRADAVIQEVRQAAGDVALFAHGHVLRVLAARWLGLPPSGGSLLALGTASLSVLGYEHDVPCILLWNDGWTPPAEAADAAPSTS